MLEVPTARGGASGGPGAAGSLLPPSPVLNPMRPAWAALVLVAAVGLAGCAADEGSDMTRPNATIETSNGTITLELYGDQAPQTVQNFGELARDGFYDGQRFHRVIQDFMIQAGDPQSTDEENRENWGTGGPGYTIPDEFACEDGTVVNDHPGGYRQPADQCDAHGGFAVDLDAAGVLAMANTGQPHTGGSQFFVTLSPQDRLTGYHTVFGEVVEGMDVVEEIGGVPTHDDQPYKDQPKKDVVIESITVGGELPGVDIDKQEA